MTESMLTQAFVKSIAFENTELKMRRMLAYQKIAKKAYSKWINTAGDYQEYDKAYESGELWTLLQTKEMLHDKSMNHWAAYIRCIAIVRNIKKTL